MHRIAILSFFFVATPAVSASAQQTYHDSLKGAIRVVDVRGRAIEVTTGVGMALRVVRLRVPPDTRVTAGGAALPFAQLQPGDVVRVSYGGQSGGAAGGYVAYAIERVDKMTGKPERAP